MSTAVAQRQTGQVSRAPQDQLPEQGQQQQQRGSVRSMLESKQFKDAIAQALPRHITPDRFVRIAILATTVTPKLLECTPGSVLGAMMKCSQYGIEPDGRRAHLIPFKNRGQYECQLIIDYKGLAELAMRSGLIDNIHADVIYEGDVFEYSAGIVSKHIPWWLRRDALKPKERGRVIGAYAQARMKSGATKAEPMSIEDIEAIRNNSQGWKAFKNGYAKQSPWDPANPTSENEMRKKTAFRRLSKWLTLSPEFRDAVEHDDVVDGQEVVDERTAALLPGKSLLGALGQLPAPEESTGRVDDDAQQHDNGAGDDAEDSARSDGAEEAGNTNGPAGASGSQSTQSDVGRDAPGDTVTDEEVGTYESFHEAMEQHAAGLKLELDAFDKLMKSLGPAGHDVKHSRTNIAMKARKTVLAAFRAGTLGMDGKIAT